MFIPDIENSWQLYCDFPFMARKLPLLSKRKWWPLSWNGGLMSYCSHPQRSHIKLWHTFSLQWMSAHSVLVHTFSNSERLLLENVEWQSLNISSFGSNGPFCLFLVSVTWHQVHWEWTVFCARDSFYVVHLRRGDPSEWSCTQGDCFSEDTLPLERKLE